MVCANPKSTKRLKVERRLHLVFDGHSVARYNTFDGIVRQFSANGKLCDHVDVFAVQVRALKAVIELTRLHCAGIVLADKVLEEGQED
jgi:hypothetical protein